MKHLIPSLLLTACLGGHGQQAVNPLQGPRPVSTPIDGAVGTAPIPGRLDCAEGLVVNVDTAGNCCWPGQTWNGTECAGRPRACPAGMRVHSLLSACVPDACPAGQVLTTEIHCCWPGQTWSAEEDRCDGTPTCPEGMGLEGDRCRTRAQDPVKPDVVQATDSPLNLPEMDKSLIDGVIRDHIPAIKACYQRVANVNPVLEGKLTVKFVIEADGSVSAVALKSSTLSDPSVGACVVEAFRSLEFPHPRGGGTVIVSYPFVFCRKAPS